MLWVAKLHIACICVFKWSCLCRCKAGLELLNAEFEKLLKKIHVLRKAGTVSEAVLKEIGTIISGLTDRKIKAVKTAQRLIQGSAPPKPKSEAKAKANGALPVPPASA